MDLPENVAEMAGDFVDRMIEAGFDGESAATVGAVILYLACAEADDPVLSAAEALANVAHSSTEVPLAGPEGEA